MAITLTNMIDWKHLLFALAYGSIPAVRLSKPTFELFDANGDPTVLLAGYLSDQFSSLEELSCTCDLSSVIAMI